MSRTLAFGQKLGMAYDGATLSGVFAVNKPATMTSATLCNVLKHKLSESDLFKPYIQQLLDEKDSHATHNNQSGRGRKARRLRGKPQIKIGHGGTLDPGASGVVTFGVQNGTKALDAMTKSAQKGYETVLLFGAATDTFDKDGKVVGRKPWESVSREKVEASLDRFRGDIMQRPSVFSALHKGGVRMYEYAREGKDIPELDERAMKVYDIEVTEWLEGGSHEYHWPEKEIENDRKQAFVKTLRFDEIGGVEVVKGSNESSIVLEPNSNGKRKRQDKPESGKSKASKESKAQEASADVDGATTGAVDNEVVIAAEEIKPADDDVKAARGPCPAPAARIRMTVASGFYVRSLCHDLGVAVGSLGMMAELRRTKQSCFELGQNVIDFEDFDRGEEVWGPKVRERLDWWEKHSKEVFPQTVQTDA